MAAPGGLGIADRLLRAQARLSSPRSSTARTATRSPRSSPYHGDYGLAALRSKALHRTEGRDQPPALKAALGVRRGVARPAAHRLRRLGARARARGGREQGLLPHARGRPVRAARQRRRGARRLARHAPSRSGCRGSCCARASIFEGTGDELTSLFLRIRMPTVAELCRTLGLEPGDVPGFSGRGDARLDQPHLPEELLGTISGRPDLRARVVAHSAETAGPDRPLRREQAARRASERLVLVDLGWGGTIQWLLDGIFARSGIGARDRRPLPDDRRARRRAHARGRAHARLPGRRPDIPAGPVDGLPAQPRDPRADLHAEPRLPGGPDRGARAGARRRRHAGDAGRRARGASSAGSSRFQREWARYRTTAPTSLVPLPRLGPGPAALDPRQGGHGAHSRRGAAVRRLAPRRELRLHRHCGRWCRRPRRARLATWSPDALVEMPMSELYWPFGLAALHDETLARSVEAVTTGAVPLGRVLLRARDRPGRDLRAIAAGASAATGWPRSLRAATGWASATRTARSRATSCGASGSTRSRTPRSCASTGSGCAAMSADSAEVVTLDFDTPEAVEQAQAERHGRGRARRLPRPGASTPTSSIDVEKLVGREVHTVDVECAFAVLPLSASPLRTQITGRAEGPAPRAREARPAGRSGARGCTRCCAGSTDPGGYPAANGRAPRESRRRGRLEDVPSSHAITS